MSPDRGAAARLPRITILTPCRNGVRFIAEAVASVRRQGYPALEHIVLDACSTDGTLALLDTCPGLRVISEPDAGAHDAMNKGVALATGEIVGFLNVDDIYPEGALLAVGQRFAEDAALDVVVGQSVVFEDDPLGQRKLLRVRTHAAGAGLWVPELAFGVPGFNGCFFRRRTFEQAEPFRTDYDFTGDRKFLIELVLAGHKSAVLDRPTIWYRLHPQSRTISHEKRHLVEISREYVGMALDLARGRARNRPERRVFLAWHAFEAAKLTVRSVRAGRWGEASRVFAALNRDDPLWPFRLGDALFYRRAVRRLDGWARGRKR
jgi:glycosyltransferase involved in cell wall biosynthesis